MPMSGESLAQDHLEILKILCLFSAISILVGQMMQNYNKKKSRAIAGL